jgi:hypothetical protein
LILLLLLLLLLLPPPPPVFCLYNGPLLPHLFNLYRQQRTHLGADRQLGLDDARVVRVPLAVVDDRLEVAECTNLGTGGQMEFDILLFAEPSTNFHGARQVPLVDIASGPGFESRPRQTCNRNSRPCGIDKNTQEEAIMLKLGKTPHPSSFCTFFGPYKQLVIILSVHPPNLVLENGVADDDEPVVKPCQVKVCDEGRAHDAP